MNRFAAINKAKREFVEKRLRVVSDSEVLVMFVT